jgi:hypothetical protein
VLEHRRSVLDQSASLPATSFPELQSTGDETERSREAMTCHAHIGKED